MWKVTSVDGRRWVSWADAGGWDADPDTRANMLAFAGQPVPVAPMGPAYTPRGDRDQVGAYLLARYLLGGAAAVTGSPPRVPSPPPIDPDVVY